MTVDDVHPIPASCSLHRLSLTGGWRSVRSPYARGGAGVTENRPNESDNGREHDASRASNRSCADPGALGGQDVYVSTLRRLFGNAHAGSEGMSDVYIATRDKLTGADG
jgi:hypothetical protein